MNKPEELNSLSEKEMLKLLLTMTLSLEMKVDALMKQFSTSQD